MLKRKTLEMEPYLLVVLRAIYNIKDSIENFMKYSEKMSHVRNRTVRLGV